MYTDSSSTFDVMDETRNTIHIDKIIEEDEYVERTETLTDPVTEKTVTSSFLDTMA